MDANAYLEKLWELNGKIKRLEKDAMQYRDMAYNISQDASKEHFNPNKSTAAPYTKCIEKADLIERAVAEKKKALADLKEEASNLIIQIDNAKYVSLLIMRYCEFWRWEDIASNLGVSDNHVYKIRREAMKAFSEIYENDSIRIDCG